MCDKETTRKIVEGYSNAWTTGDLNTARTFLADNLEFRGSIDNYDDADSLISSIGVFLHILKSVNVISAFYDAGEAILMYDCVTESPAGTIRTVEYFKVEDKRRSKSKITFQ